jgi:isopenicillin N synthase-like dioxygenase
VAEEQHALSQEDYVKQHWVSDEAGFYAVTGKMSAEEEDSMLRSVVEIFGKEGEEPAAKRHCRAAEQRPTVPASPDETIIPRELIMDPRRASLSLPLCTQSDFESKSERAGVIALWRRHGYLILDAPGIASPVETLQAACESFFELEGDEKRRCVDPNEVYLGYQRRDAFDKELFQVRETLLEGQWPTAQQPSLQPAAQEMFQRLSDLADMGIESALCEAGVQSPYATQLLAPCHPKRNQVSPTNLTLFRYRVALGETRTNVHCPYHTDVGLATVIPKCRGRGSSQGITGLHLFDFHHSCWMDVEVAMSDTQVVVFAGEQLAFLTNGYMTPGIHEVSHVNGERFSSPLQRLANPRATLDNTAGAEAIVGKAASPSKVNALEFVHRLSATRVSSNFPRGIVQTGHAAA